MSHIAVLYILEAFLLFVRLFVRLFERAMAAASEDLSQQKQQHGQQNEPYLPPGFRFHPTDEELVSYYLTKKVLDSSFAVRAIAEVDLNKCEPWDLPG